MNFGEILKKGFDKVANTSLLDFSPIGKVADTVAKSTKNTIDDKVVSTVKQYTTPKAISSGANTLAKAVANGFATFATSAAADTVRGGAAIIGEVTGNETAKKIATTKIGDINYGGPVGQWMGPVKTYGDRVLDRKAEGQGNVEAIAKSGAEAALDNPFGTGIKTVGFMGSLALKESGPAFKAALKTIAESKSGKQIAELLTPLVEGGKKSFDSLVGKLIKADNPQAVEKVILDSVEAKPGTVLDAIKNDKGGLTPMGKETVDDIKIPDNRFEKTVNTLNIPQKNKAVILNEAEAVKKTLAEVIGKPLTTDEVVKAAAKIEANVDNPILRETTKQMEANFKAAKDALASVSFKKGVNNEELKQILLFIESYKTNAGRLLNSVKMGGEALPPEIDMFIKVQKDLEKQGKSIEDILKAGEKYDLNTLEGQQQLYRELANSNWEKWLDKLRMNSMLSSPSTHFINLTSNIEGIGLMRPLTKAVAGGIDAARSALTGSERTQFAGEVVPYMKGLVDPKAWKEGAARAMDSLRGVQSFENVDLRSFDLSNKNAEFLKNPGQYLVAKAESFLDLIPRMTSAIDNLTATVGKNAEEAALKLRVSKGAKLAEEATGNINKLISEMSEKAMDSEVFRGKLVNETDGLLSNWVGEMTQKVQSFTYAKNPVLRLPAKFTLPFLRTAGNIVKTGIESGPQGLINLIGAKNKTEVVAKALIGSSIMTAAFTAAGGGKITAGYPTSQSEKDVWEKNGVTPYSVYINGKWVAYDKLHPAVAFPLAIAATLSQTANELKYSDSQAKDISLASIGAIAKFVGSQGYARSFGSLLSALNGDEQEASKIFSSIPSQLIPARAFLSWVDRLTSPVVAKTKEGADSFEKTLQQIGNQMPDWIVSPADYKVDDAGKAIPNPAQARPGNFTNALITSLGFKVSSTTKSIVEEMAGFKNAESFMKVENKKTAEQKAAMESMLKDFNNASSPEAKKEILTTYIKENPDMVKKLKEAIKKQVKDAVLTPEEKKMSNMTKAVKLKYIAEKIKGMETKEEKIKYVKHLQEIGLIE